MSQPREEDRTIKGHNRQTTKTTKEHHKTNTRNRITIPPAQQNESSSRSTSVASSPLVLPFPLFSPFIHSFTYTSTSFHMPDEARSSLLFPFQVRSAFPSVSGPVAISEYQQDQADISHPAKAQRQRLGLLLSSVSRVVQGLRHLQHAVLTRNKSDISKTNNSCVAKVSTYNAIDVSAVPIFCFCSSLFFSVLSLFLSEFPVCLSTSWKCWRAHSDHLLSWCDSPCEFTLKACFTLELKRTMLDLACNKHHCMFRRLALSDQSAVTMHALDERECQYGSATRVSDSRERKKQQLW